MTVMTREDCPILFEFFAGGGMARLGLGPHWDCRFANDCDRGKAEAYRAAFGHRPDTRDVANLKAGDLPGTPDLVWASPPCQDLSLAGRREGLGASRSGAFFAFWRLMQDLQRERRAPGLVVIENVTGLLTSNAGNDFRRLCAALGEADYRFGALVQDAADFLPQSRPRLFLIAVKEGRAVPAALIAPAGPDNRRVAAARDGLHASVRENWIDWSLPAPPKRTARLADLLDRDVGESAWLTPEKTARLVAQMDAGNRARLDAALSSKLETTGTIFRRTRRVNGQRVQRAEIRFDGVAGCLRTPGGGSSRQILAVIADGRLRTRLLTPRETARLMGLPDSYPLPKVATQAYRLTGDGVAVPVVDWLNRHLLLPLLEADRTAAAA